MSRYLVYGLRDPHTKELRYIGQTARGIYRPRSHLSPSAGLKKSRLGCWLFSLQVQGLRPEIIVLAELQSRDELNATEIDLIAYFRCFGARLCNEEPGGYHQKTIRHGAAVRRRMSEKRQGLPHTEQWTRNISDAHRAAYGKPVIAEDDSGFFIIFPSIADANRNGWLRGNIQQCLKGNKSSYRGYKWRPVDG